MSKPIQILAAGLAASLAYANPGFAADAGCAAFKWPVATEQAWFADAGIAQVQSGAKLATLPKAGVAVALVDASGVTYALPPAGKPKDGATKDAVLNIGALDRASTYQVTLSDEAWIDLVQDGKFVDSIDHSGATGCPGVRKIVRFKLSAGPLVVQISKASVASLKLAIEPVQ